MSGRRAPACRFLRRRAAPCRARAPGSTTCGNRASRSALRRLGAPGLPALLDEGPGGLRTAPAAELHLVLIALERLVRAEKGLDLAQPVLGQVLELADLIEPRVSDRHGEDLLVLALRVRHEQRADRPSRQ